MNRLIGFLFILGVRLLFMFLSPIIRRRSDATGSSRFFQALKSDLTRKKPKRKSK